MSVPAAGSGERAASGGLRFRSRFLLSCLLGVTVLIVYSPLSQFPFVQDDWVLIHGYTFHSTSRVLIDMFTPTGKFFYRPLATFYCWLVYTLFGLHPAGFHLLALFFLVISSFLVVSVADVLTGDQSVAWGSGFLYAAASNVHIDTQMWLVGIIDIGAVLFGLLCVNSFIRRRYAVSALWFAMALGFKEGMAMLLFVLVAWTLLSGREPADEKPMLRRCFNRLRWHSLAFLALCAAKVTGVSIFALRESHPYAARLIGNHIGTNFQLFALLSLQAVTPLKNVVFSEYGALMTLFIVTALLVLIFIGAIKHFGGKGKEIDRPLVYTLFIAVWLLLLLFPSLTLENHFNRYYLTPALPPLAMGTMLLFRTAHFSAGRNARFILYATIVFAAANVIDGTVLIYRRAGLGVLDGVHAAAGDGDNHLIRKASIVREVWKPLLAVLPSVPPHSLLVLEDVPTRCFADRYGAQVWYGDSTLTLTSSVPEGPDSLGMLHATVDVEDPWDKPTKPPVISFPASRTIHARYTQGGMELVQTGYRTE